MTLHHIHHRPHGHDPTVIDTDGHTLRDAAALVEALGPDGPKLTQPRDIGVQCPLCPPVPNPAVNGSFHQAGYCDQHYIAPYAVHHPEKYNRNAS